MGWKKSEEMEASCGGRKLGLDWVGYGALMMNILCKVSGYFEESS
jgi:hypothetical protein